MIIVNANNIKRYFGYIQDAFFEKCFYFSFSREILCTCISNISGESHVKFMWK